MCFNNLYLFILIIIIQLENLFFFVFKNTIFFIKNLQTKLVSEKNLDNGISLNISFFFLWLILISFFIKGELINCNFNFFNFSLVYVLLNILILYYKSTREKYFSIHIIFIFLILYIVVLSNLVSFLELFIFIEIYGTLYFFFFSFQRTDNTRTLNSYKVNLSLLLWNNFLTSLLLTISLYLFLFRFNSTNFLELYFLSNYSIPVYIYILGFFFKIGLPTFHFFKYEIYLYLIEEYIFLFPILTTLINANILSFFTNILIINAVVSQTYFIYFFLINLLSFILFNLNSNTIVSYFATSSIITISFIFLINIAIYVCS